MQQNWQGIFIPKELYLTKELTWIEKILFIEVNQFSRNNGYTETNAYLAKSLNVSTTTITNGIHKLKNLGLIQIQSFDGRKRFIKTDIEKLHKLKHKSQTGEPNNDK